MTKGAGKKLPGGQNDAGSQAKPRACRVLGMNGRIEGDRISFPLSQMRELTAGLAEPNAQTKKAKTKQAGA